MFNCAQSDSDSYNAKKLREVLLLICFICVLKYSVYLTNHIGTGY